MLDLSLVEQANLCEDGTAAGSSRSGLWADSVHGCVESNRYGRGPRLVDTGRKSRVLKKVDGLGTGHEGMEALAGQRGQQARRGQRVQQRQRMQQGDRRPKLLWLASGGVGYAWPKAADGDVHETARVHSRVGNKRSRTMAGGEARWMVMADEGMSEWISDGQAGDKRRVVARAALSLGVVPSWLDHGEDGVDEAWGHVMRLPVRATIGSGRSGWRALIGRWRLLTGLPPVTSRLPTGQATITVVVNHHDAACPLTALSLLFPPLPVPDARRLFLFLPLFRFLSRSCSCFSVPPHRASFYLLVSTL
jgi:hypothetical protein